MTIEGSITSFTERWQGSGASERANYQLFLTELCHLLDVPRPEPQVSSEQQNAYVFEKSVPLHHEDGTVTTGRIDLYRRGCFVLEAKQGSAATVATPLFGGARGAGKTGTARRGSSGWDNAMQKAKNQAERYARELAAGEGRPPFLVVVDVGHSIELYSEFSRSGGSYVPYPDPQSHRIFLNDLEHEEIRDRLRRVWLDPLSLDPSLKAARVTQEIATQLAELATSLEAQDHHPDEVAGFLMRVIFTMFAEDTGLIPHRSFKGLLESIKGDTAHFVHIVEPLWATMNTGGYSTSLRTQLLHFNGGLFATPKALPINEMQLELLIKAAAADWRDVEPAIFGTLLERALNPRERHKLGAHYTPRAYVERLVQSTLIEPLRDEWQGVQAAVAQHLLSGKAKEAEGVLRTFHHYLCHLRVLDPASGSGNFLYVSLELLKRLEGEVLEMLEAITGQDQGRLEMQGVTVSPEQFLGLEINPRAAKIAELMLWLGYLQWHFRTRGNVLPAEPVIRDFKNIQCKDAVLEYDGTEAATDRDGKPITHWDGHTMKTHPITGKDVPDETAQVEELRYLNPREAAWPKADFIVGNPPFIGNKYMRQALGHGYSKAVREVHDDVPESADFVMYW